MGFETHEALAGLRLSRRVIAPWLTGKLLKTKDAVRRAPGGLGTVGSLLG